MAYGDTPSQAEPGSGGGNTFDPNDVGGAGWHWDAKQNTWVFGWQTSGGGVVPARGGQNSAAAPSGGGGAPIGGFAKFLKAIGGGRTLADVALGAGSLYLQNKQANNAQNAANEAQRAQNEAAQKAIDLQKEMYQTTRNDLAPYRALGQGASAGLGYFMGIPGYEQGNRGVLPPSAMGQRMTSPANQSPTTPNAMPNTSLTGGGSVLLMAPDGTRREVPRDQVDHYLGLGAKVVA